MHHPAMARDPVLTPEERRFVADARRAVLATVDPRGRPRLVPICHVLGNRDDDEGRPLLYTPIDDKPKAMSDPRALARVRDLLARPGVRVLVDRWDEDWTRLGWLRLHGAAVLLAPNSPEAREHAAAVGLLRSKYRQYRDHPLENRPIIRIAVDEARGWGAINGSATGTRG
jgi:PPOX class probable F420-dependent enzyme